MISAGLRSRLEFAAKSFLVVSFLGSVLAGVLRLQQKALADSAHHADLGRWSVVERPAWCGLDDVSALRDSTRLGGWRASVLHPGSGPVVWRSLELCPRVARVAGMQARLPNQFEVVIELRRPVAAVELGAGASRTWVEVDAEGVALAAPVGARPARPVTAGGPAVPLRVITGAAEPAPLPGARFGAAVADAADLAAELDRFGTIEDRALLRVVDEIDVAARGARTKPGASDVVLRTAAPKGGTAPPCDVEWGRVRPIDPYDTEEPFAAKAARLVQALRMFPRLDGLRTVKVAFADLVVVPKSGSPLAAPPVRGDVRPSPERPRR